MTALGHRDFNKHDKTQLLAKLKKNVYIVFGATLSINVTRIFVTKLRVTLKTIIG